MRSWIGLGDRSRLPARFTELQSLLHSRSRFDLSTKAKDGGIISQAERLTAII